MFDDEDYGFLTGGLGDLDGDGKVDFTEYIIEEDDFQRIMDNTDDDDSFSDDEDDDWKDIYTDTADELGLDLDNYFDEDEFLEAAEEATADADDDENEDDEEYDEEDVIPFKDFDISKLSLTIGAHTSLDYDGKPIDEVFGADSKETAHDKISLAEYKKLKNENKALKSRITHLEKRITDLNYNIQRLEADLEAKRKPVKKEWDGKYYRYCQVRLDESRNDLW